MCGIVGYTGAKSATEILIGGLSNLEYRGYDSAGISVYGDGKIHTIKVKGRLSCLVERLEADGNPQGSCGIGHTRWATHGEPSDKNSHPHYTEKVTLVHNGIIENYLQIREYLTEKGYAFTSDTDTETAVKLLDFHYKKDPREAIARTLEMLEGSYAFAILFADFPSAIYAVRKDSPLIIGAGEGENFIASDVPAILEHTRNYYLLEEGELAAVTKEAVEIRTLEGKPVEKKLMTANWTLNQAQKSGYPHFMLKEIFEQPRALIDTVHPRVRDGVPDFTADGIPKGFFGRYRRVQLIACGTACHACMVGKNLIEKLARVPCEVDIASEFRYRDPVLEQDTLVVVISQSGETADTLAAMRLVKARGLDTLAIVNVAGSSVAREADYLLHTYAGPEIAVASTKAFSVQIAVLYLMAIAVARDVGKLDAAAAALLTKQLLECIDKVEDVLEFSEPLKDLAPRFTETTSLFYLGRGIDYSLAMEGSLKLKEISYIHSEAYTSGEIKHGTISLITKGVPVVALITQKDLMPKTVSNVKEARSRGGDVIIICKDGFAIDEDLYDHIVRLPAQEDLFMPLLSVVVLQLFAYHIAVARGCDVDKPRNLAKSVTVE